MTVLYAARTRVEASEWRADITITGTADPDNATISIPAGDYYIRSGTAAQSLIDAIDDALETAYPASNFTTSFDPGTGAVTIAIAAGTMSWAWNTGTYGTAFRNYLGFASIGNWGPLATKTGVRCQGLIYTGSTGFSVDSRAKSPKIVGVARAAAGPVAKVAKTTRLYDYDYEHRNEPAEQVTSPSFRSGVYDIGNNEWAWKDFFDHCAVHPFRVWEGTPGDADMTDPLYELELALESSKMFAPPQRESGVDANRIVRIAGHKYVA